MPFWIAASHLPAPRGGGIWGTSLVPGPIFDHVLWTGGVIQPIVGYLDIVGEAVVAVHYPPEPLPAGLFFFAGFSVFPELPRIVPWIPSPAWAVAIS